MTAAKTHRVVQTADPDDSHCSICAAAKSHPILSFYLQFTTFDTHSFNTLCVLDHSIATASVFAQLAKILLEENDENHHATCA